MQAYCLNDGGDSTQRNKHFGKVLLNPFAITIPITVFQKARWQGFSTTNC